MRNPLQEQLLKAGLAQKQKVDAAAREQARRRDGKLPAAPSAQVDAQRLQAEKAERDRALAAERNAEARAKELKAQIRQIIETHQVAPAGELAYRFVDGSKIKELKVSEAQRKLLAKGALVIVAHEQSYALLPQADAAKIYERGGSVVVDHARPAEPAPAAPSSDEEYYQRFVVPDDLMW